MKNKTEIKDVDIDCNTIIWLRQRITSLEEQTKKLNDITELLVAILDDSKEIERKSKIKNYLVMMALPQHKI